MKPLDDAEHAELWQNLADARDAVSSALLAIRAERIARLEALGADASDANQTTTVMGSRAMLAHFLARSGSDARELADLFAAAADLNESAHA